MLDDGFQAHSSPISRLCGPLAEMYIRVRLSDAYSSEPLQVPGRGSCGVDNIEDNVWFH
jgi:hypothetical protein